MTAIIVIGYLINIVCAVLAFGFTQAYFTRKWWQLDGGINPVAVLFVVVSLPIPFLGVVFSFMSLCLSEFGKYGILFRGNDRKATTYRGLVDEAVNKGDGSWGELYAKDYTEL